MAKRFSFNLFFVTKNIEVGHREAQGKCCLHLNFCLQSNTSMYMLAMKDANFFLLRERVALIKK